MSDESNNPYRNYEAYIRAKQNHDWDPSTFGDPDGPSLPPRQVSEYRSGGAGFDVAGKVIVIFLVGVGVSVWALSNWVASGGSSLRDTLEVFLPDSWLAQTPDGSGKPAQSAAVVGVGFVVVTAAVFVGLRVVVSLTPSWVLRHVEIFIACAVLILVVSFGIAVVLNTVGVALGNDLDVTGSGDVDSWVWWVVLATPFIGSALITFSSTGD